MDGFTKLPKMQHFKAGGGVKNAYCGGGKAYKKGGEVSHEDIVEDKKIVKKAFNIHDKQQHEEKTDLSKLKKGGRAKKETGTVKKYCGGKSVKKYEDGGSVAGQGAVSDKERSLFGRLKENVMGTPEQNAAAQKSLDKVATQPSLSGAVERAIRKGINTPVTKKRGGKC